MRILILLNIIFLIISCSENSWKSKVRLELSQASNIRFSPLYLNKGDVTNPPNTWVSLISFKRNELHKCLFYKTPYDSKQGELKLVEGKRRKCSAFDKGVILKDNFSSLRLNFSFDKSEKDRGYIVFSFSSKNNKEKEQRVRIPLLNFSTAKKYKKYSNQLPVALISDVAMGEMKSKSTLKTGDLCHGVNRECKDVVSKKCDQCPEGFFEVVDNNCPQGGSKYCGRNRCGQKNQPACPRGYKVLDTKLSALCFEGSPAGFCKPGLYTSCNSDGILVCL